MNARAVLPLLLLAMAWALPPAAQARDLEPGFEDLFQWGEYDSLIRSLEPWLAARSAGGGLRDDSLELARANLILGVAYLATNRKTLGEQALVRACRLDPDVSLNRLYATPEIMARFETIAAYERQQREQQIADGRDSWVRHDLKAAGSDRAMARRRGLGWKGWVVGAVATAGLAAGGGYAYYALVDRKPKEIIIPVLLPPDPK